MGDLQCAARFVLVADDDETALRRERPVAVVAGPGAADTAAALAAGLDVPSQDLDTGAGLGPALDDLADEYRGECVAVVLTPTALADLAHRHGRAAGGGGVVVEVDADGQSWGPWPVSDATGR